MRVFASGGRLRALSFHARLVYSAFLAMVLAGLAVSGALAHAVSGLDLSRVREHYAGEAPSEAVVETEVALELPDEEDAPVAMSARTLLETTHFHLFAMPVLFLILAHVFLLTRASSAWKTACIALGALGIVSHALAPWIAAAAWPGSVAFYGASGALLFFTHGAMCVVPIWEMWTGD